MPYSPEIPPHFYRFSCRLFRPSGNFPPNSSPEALRPCLPSIINKDNSPVIRRTADRQQRKSSQLHTRRKYRCPYQTGQRYFLSSLIIKVTLFSAAVCSSISPAVCEFPGTVLRFFSVFLSHTRSECRSLSWALPGQPHSLGGISFLVH